MGSMTQFSSEHSKESPRWLRDLLSLFHNKIAQTQRLSGTLAVMAKAIGKAYFMRRRFLLYRISCRGMQRNGGTSRKYYHVFGVFSWQKRRDAAVYSKYEEKR